MVRSYHDLYSADIDLSKVAPVDNHTSEMLSKLLALPVEERTFSIDHASSLSGFTPETICSTGSSSGKHIFFCFHMSYSIY